MPEIISVTCVNTVDPPYVIIVIAGEVPLVVSTAIYEILKGPLGLPDNPCDLG